MIEKYWFSLNHTKAEQHWLDPALQTGLSLVSIWKWSNSSETHGPGEYRKQTRFVKSSGLDAIHLAGPPTGRRPQQRPASSQQRLVARRRVAPPPALFTALLIKVIASVSAAERGARATRGWESEGWKCVWGGGGRLSDMVNLRLGLETTCRRRWFISPLYANLNHICSVAAAHSVQCDWNSIKNSLL